MSPHEENEGNIVDFRSRPKEEFPDLHNEAILELSPLLDFKPETLMLYFEIMQNNDFEEGFFASRLRSRFQFIKRNQLERNEEILCYLGLDSYNDKIYDYVTSCCSQEDDHLDITDCTVLYMQDLLRYGLFLENVFVKFPYQDSIVNTWFKQAGEQEDGSNKEVNLLNKLEENHQQLDPYPSLDGKCFPDGLKEDGYKLLYHGTDQMSAAVSILKRGIKLEMGKPNKDFSHGKGFYLNDKYHGAWKWAFRKQNPKQAAVLIFKVPNQDLDDFRPMSINLVDNESKWEQTIKGFRFNPSDKFLEKFEQTSFIEGPIASFYKDINGSMINGALKDSYQMCIHSDDLAEVFDTHLHAIVFFNSEN